MNLIKIFHSELYKFRKANLWPILLLSPLLCGLIAYYSASSDWASGEWLDTYSNLIVVHGMYLLPLLAGVIVALICRYEHSHGGWKHYLAQPVHRWQVYVVKFVIASAAIALIQFLIFLALFGVGKLTGIDAPLPFTPIARSLFNGWLATFPLIALQLWVTTAWSSFAAPMALNVIFTLPAVLIVGSATYGPYYPWAQPLLAMAIPSDGMTDFAYLPTETLLLVVIGGFLIFFIGGLWFFQKRAY